jgi:hypothetical protein
MGISWLSAKTKNFICQNQTFKLGDNIQNHHAQLQIVLSSYRTSSLRLQNVQLPLGLTGSMNVDIATSILIVIQDMQEGDALCGCYGPHTPNSMPFSIVQCQLHTVRFSLFHMSLFVGHSHGIDCG